MHSRLLHQDVQQELKVDHGVDVGVQQRTLGHAADDLPQFGLLHAVLGQGEHHARVDGDVLGLLGQRVLQLGRPDGARLAVADALDELAGAAGDGRQVLAERGIAALGGLLGDEALTALDIFLDEVVGLAGHLLGYLLPLLVCEWHLAGLVFGLLSGRGGNVCERRRRRSRP